MHIHFGDEVYGSDGHKAGEVKGVVVDSGAQRVTRILVHSGAFKADLLLDFGGATSEADGRLSVDISNASLEQQPRFDSEEHVFASRSPEEPLLEPAAGVGGPVMYADTTPTDGFPGKDLFDTAPLDPPTVEIMSNLNTNEVMLHKGSDIVSKDQHKIGDLDGLATSDFGAVESIEVREGFIFKHSLRIPVGSISEFDKDKIHLLISKEEAEALEA